jgi:xanthine dehydrogenase YagS FAD-binding subunit
MEPFEYTRPHDLTEALAQLRSGGRALAGGTGLVDLMRLGVERPSRLVDLNPLAAQAGASIGRIEEAAGGLRIGALVRNSDLAHDPRVQARFPVLSQALLAGASAQIRNAATVGGNLLQRTRCPYFRDGVSACNRRQPGSGCSVQLDGGDSRGAAILGGSEACVAVHPSDLCVALGALGATLVVLRQDGREHELALNGFHQLPGKTPEIETALAPGELIVAVTLKDSPRARRSRYVKVRDRASFDFALASAAVAIELRDGVVRELAIVLGGVATRPWHASDATSVLLGQKPTPERIKQAAEAAVRGARPLAHNGFKVELARRVVARALHELLDEPAGASP